MRWSSPADRVVGWLLPILAIVAEGALLAVVYVAVETAIDHRAPLLGTFELALATGGAALAVRRGWVDPDEDPMPFFVLLAALGLTGWMWDASVRELVFAGDPLAALSLHPGGWLMVVAGMRGIGRGIEIDDRALTRLVLVGVPSLAVPWIIGQLGAGDLRDTFTEEAFVASLTFVTAGFIAAGLARLREIGRETGIDWRHNRSWLGTVFGVLVLVLALGIPASILLGLPGDAVARGILGPIVTLFGYLVAAGFTLAALIAALLARALRQLGIVLPQPITDGDPFGELRPYTLEEVGPLMTGVVAVWIVIAVVLIVLARVWLHRRVARPAGRGSEERSFRIPQRSFRLRVPRPAPPPPFVPLEPTDAVTAYLASLDDLAAHDPGSAHGEHETPRAHARRVQAGTELDALQADYALDRYGNRPLTDAEHRRAIGRWQRLRSRLRAR